MSPQGERYLPLDSPTSQGPRAFVVNPPARHSACVGRHSPLLTRSPRSHLVPRCRLRRLPPLLLSLTSNDFPVLVEGECRWCWACFLNHMTRIRLLHTPV